MTVPQPARYAPRDAAGRPLLYSASRPDRDRLHQAVVRRDNAPTYLTVSEVAARFRVSRMTVYRLLHAGELPGVRVGRSFRISEAAADQFLNGAAIEPDTAG